MTPYDPEHLPQEIELIEAISRPLSRRLAQVACFDTAFHRDHAASGDAAADSAPLVGRGVQRYGFHGLSYTFLMQELAAPAATRPPREGA